MRKTRPRTPEEAYLLAATDLQHARDAHDHRRGNKAFDRMMQAAREIRLSDSDGGIHFFSSLLDSNMPHVVISAAFNLIPLNSGRARKVLEELAKGPASEIRFDAEMTLTEWDAGRLDPEWFMKQ